MSATAIPSALAHPISSALVLLVAADFDGTLSPLAEHHSRAEPTPGALAALDRLSEIPNTHVAIVSGRGLEDVRLRLGRHDRWDLFGSHGAEVHGDASQPIPSDLRDRLRELDSRLEALCDRFAGLTVESKPRGIAVHYRALTEGEGAVAEEAVLRLATEFPELGLQAGTKVVEFLADRVTKADALCSLRTKYGASVVVFIGDDLTDEHAFRSLRPCDFGIKVGQGDTAARFRLLSVDDVVRFLSALADFREAWSRNREGHQ